MLTRILTLSLSAALVLPAAAAATTRYAAPGASGPEPCAQGAPCGLTSAIGGAVNGDEVVVEPGDYTIGTAATSVDCSTQPMDGITITHNITVHGVAGQPRPHIIGANGVCDTLYATVSTTLRHLAVSNSTTPLNGLPQAVLAGAGTIDDVIATCAQTIAMHVGAGVTIENSVALSQGGFTIQGSGPNVVVRNTTTNGEVFARGVGSGTGTSMTATNVIALQGFAATPGTATPTTFTVDHSYGSLSGNGGTSAVTDGGNNLQSNQNPVFIDAANGDYHEASGSPTIDAGADNSTVDNATKDFDGGARHAGMHTDIGADEFGSAIPATTTGDSSSVTSSGATIAGSVDANGVATTVHFEYGVTTAYGSQTSALSVAGDFASHAVSADLTGLTPSTTYHYRLVGGDGLSYGDDRTFTTSAAPATPITSSDGGAAVSGGAPQSGGGDGMPTAVPAAPAATRFALVAVRANPTTGGARLTLVIPGAGVLNVLDTTSRHAARVLAIFHLRRVYSSAGRVLLVLKPTAAARKLLLRTHVLKTRLTVRFTPLGGTGVHTTRTLVLRLRKR